MRLDDRFGQVESQSSALRPAAQGTLDAIEAIKDAIPLPDWDADPLVADSDIDVLVVVAARDGDLALLGRVLDRI